MWIAYRMEFLLFRSHVSVIWWLRQPYRRLHGRTSSIITEDRSLVLLLTKISRDCLHRIDGLEPRDSVA